MANLTVPQSGTSRQLSIFDKPDNGDAKGSKTAGKQIAIYHAPNSDIEFAIDPYERKIWASQRQIAELMGITVQAVSQQIQIFKEQRGSKADSSIKKFFIVASDGKQREVEHYDLLIITYIGFRAHETDHTIAFQEWVADTLDRVVRDIQTSETTFVQEPEVPKVQPPRTRSDKTVFAMAIVHDQETHEQALARVEDRRSGVYAFRQMQASFHEFVTIGKPLNYGQAINTEYCGVFGAPAKALKAALQVKELRDGLTARQLQTLNLCEAMIDDAIRRSGNMTADQALYIIDKIARTFGELLASVSDPIIGNRRRY